MEPAPGAPEEILPGNAVETVPVEPEWVNVRVLAPLVPFPRTFWIVQLSVAVAVPFQYCPLRFQMGELWAAPLVAAVVLAQAQLTALVWLKLVVNPAMARVRLAVGLIRADQALLPPLAGGGPRAIPAPERGGRRPGATPQIGDAQVSCDSSVAAGRQIDRRNICANQSTEGGRRGSSA